MKPTISNIKYMLRRYADSPWCCIWRDETGVHIERHYWDAVTFGQVKWARYKWLR